MNMSTDEKTKKGMQKKSKRYAQADKKRCVACGACTKECPRSAILIFKGCYAVVDKDRCIGCGKCKTVCPADTIQLIVGGNENE